MLLNEGSRIFYTARVIGAVVVYVWFNLVNRKRTIT